MKETGCLTAGGFGVFVRSDESSLSPWDHLAPPTLFSKVGSVPQTEVALRHLEWELRLCRTPNVLGELASCPNSRRLTRGVFNPQPKRGANQVREWCLWHTHFGQSQNHVFLGKSCLDVSPSNTTTCPKKKLRCLSSLEACWK